MLMVTRKKSFCVCWPLCG